jgi:hypothetical protein
MEENELGVFQELEKNKNKKAVCLGQEREVHIGRCKTF